MAIPVLCEGEAGLMPGAAISVEPSGMPAGGLDRVASGDVMPMPDGGCTVDEIAWATAPVGPIHTTKASNDAHRTVEAILHDLNCSAWRRFEESGFRICGAPAGFLSSNHRELRKHRYFHNARTAVWPHDGRCRCGRPWPSLTYLRSAARALASSWWHVTESAARSAMRARSSASSAYSKSCP